MLQQIKQINIKAQQNFEKRLSNIIKSYSENFFAYNRNKQRTKVKISPLKNKQGKSKLGNFSPAPLQNTSYFTPMVIEEI